MREVFFLNNTKKIVLTSMGTLIGAGFASGREIYQFFFRFGKMGLLGIVVSGILTGIIIYITLKISNMKEIDNYDELIENINENKKHTKLKYILKIIANIFLLISFYIMVSGFGAYINQVYNVEKTMACSIFAIILYLVLLKNIQGILNINNILVPIILILILYLGIKNLPYIIGTRPIIVAEEKTSNWLIYSILYTSYNSIILIPVLIAMRKYINNKKEILSISILSTACIIILALCIFGLMLKQNSNIGELEMPILEIVSGYGIIIEKIYGLIIIISIFTSAISVNYSFLENISTSKKYKRNLFIICISSILISNIGFSTLVRILYPLFGFFGIIQLIFLFKSYLNLLEKNREN